MSICLRNRKFHYRFQVGGKSYSGPCPIAPVPEGAPPKTIETLRRAATKAEAEIRARVLADIMDVKEKEREIRKNKTVAALLENYRLELSGGSPILLEDAIALAEAKPSRKKCAAVYASIRRTHYADFVAFMKATYPGITDLASVRRQHCESDVSYLVEHGRFVKQIKYTRDIGKVRKKTRAVSYETDLRLSPKTIQGIVSICHWVFRRLEEDAGITRDPWKDVILPQGERVSREIFTPEELQKIWNGMQQDDFCYPLFLVAANSGMTEGDICTLQWSEVDWVRNCIRRDRRKTGADIILPLLPQLADYLASLPKDGKYVFPEHAELYLSRRSAVPRKVISFLQSLGIETKKKVPGRRAVSVKDLHSMRHVFCYMATRAGLPRSSSAQMVGHMDERMTAHYAAHETAADLNAEIRKLSSPFSFGEGESSMPFRKQLAELAYRLPEEVVRRLVESLTAKAETENCQHLIG